MFPPCAPFFFVSATLVVLRLPPGQARLRRHAWLIHQREDVGAYANVW
jgi:hypothetical protein